MTSLIRGGEDLIAKAEEGLVADVLVLLLSETSCPTRWPRERWEPILFDQTRHANVELVTVLLSGCPFPPLLRRRNFFDAATNPRTAMRLLKRWRSWKLMSPQAVGLSECLIGLEGAARQDADTLPMHYLATVYVDSLPRYLTCPR
jgi:hypothetical protein